jgi:DNA invertase Pin-like site-specific DNA recombinase
LLNADILNGGSHGNYRLCRVSSLDQDYDGQVDRLTTCGCEKVYAEKASGKSRDGRPELQKCLRRLKSGDTLVITRREEQNSGHRKDSRIEARPRVLKLERAA